MITDDYVFFWSGPFSQWRPSIFVIDGVKYNCAEQYMMAMKAKLFGDEEMYHAIMITNDPSKQKAMGRNVRNFDKVKWEQEAKVIVYRATLAKFTQNRDLWKALSDTGNRLIVEASPHDTIWGIGLREDDPRCLDPKQWLGLNWLGEICTQVRDDIRNMPIMFTG